jgi:Potential Queuosine, Q, salvage protein family
MDQRIRDPGDQSVPRGDFELETEDRLGILRATASVLRQAQYVRLDASAIPPVVDRFALAPWPEQLGLDSLHFFDGTERTVNWVLVLDALNFCFWGEPGAPRWRIQWRGQILDGYYALAASLSRAVDEGCPVWDAAFLAAIDRQSLADILRPVPGSAEIPLLDSRLENVREVGRVLLDRYDGQFASAVAQAGKSAVALAELLARDFSSFRDVSQWHRVPVPFLKRAQICVADLHASFQGKAWGAFVDLDQLTAFADYKLPQLLRTVGVLVYSEELAQLVDQLVPIVPGSVPEIEIRSATIWGVEWLRRALRGRGMSRSASAIDYRLWLDSQKATPDTLPYHRTRTIYY